MIERSKMSRQEGKSQDVKMLSRRIVEGILSEWFVGIWISGHCSP